MKYIIKESQVDKILSMFEGFIKSLRYDNVCDIDVYYEDTMDSFYINVFFKKSYVIELYEKGGKELQMVWSKKIINQIKNDISGFINYKFEIYTHVKDC